MVFNPRIRIMVQNVSYNKLEYYDYTPLHISNADINYYGLYIQTSFGNHILLSS